VGILRMVGRGVMVWLRGFSGRGRGGREIS
jgi:hypothetical protein